MFADGMEIPCRTLTYGEYRAYRDLFASGHVDPWIIWDDIYNRVVLDQFFREQFPDDGRAGVPSSVARTIYRLSAPQDVDDLIQSFDVYRLHINDLEEQMKVVILHYFPGYTMADLDDCSFNTLMRLFAGAEYLIKSKPMIDEGQGFDFVRPGEQEQPSSATISNRELAQHNRVVSRG